MFSYLNDLFKYHSGFFIFNFIFQNMNMQPAYTPPPALPALELLRLEHFQGAERVVPREVPRELGGQARSLDAERRPCEMDASWLRVPHPSLCIHFQLCLIGDSSGPIANESHALTLDGIADSLSDPGCCSEPWRPSPRAPERDGCCTLPHGRGPRCEGRCPCTGGPCSPHAAANTSELFVFGRRCWWKTSSQWIWL